VSFGFDRRRLLKALGLGAASTLVRGGRPARAGGTTFPSRIVFYVQPHGHIPNAWKMDVPGASTGQFAARPLAGLAQSDLSPTLQPLYAFRDRLLAIEGLAHTSALADIEAVTRAGAGDLNNHQVGVADVLTGTRALQRTGTYCTGGAATIDQVLAARLSAPGRFDSRVYGYDYIPNSIVSPFSYLGPGQATPMVSDPAAAFSDLLGYVKAPSTVPSRAELIAAKRASVLDAVSREYDLLAPQLGAEGKAKLDAHRDLVRELEASVGVAPSATCNTAFDATPASTSGAGVRQFMNLIRVAFTCDLTRIVTFSAPVPQCPELGYPATATFHGYAHQSIDGATSCGQTFNPVAAQAMTDLDAWHAAHVAYLLQQLDSVAEGSGTLLDHTVVVWVTELATPTHLHYDTLTVLAGGCNGFFGTGRYVRYPKTMVSPMANQPLIGPAHNRLLVSLLQAMGQPDTTFGMSGTTAIDGTALSFAGPLAELRGA
jgi:uncharacterized protein DUF1552